MPCGTKLTSNKMPSSYPSTLTSDNLDYNALVLLFSTVAIGAHAYQLLI